MYWDQRHECMSRDELSGLQLKRLQRIVEHTYSNVDDYRSAMQANGILPGDIHALDDITGLPFMTKQDLRDSYPYGRFAVPLSEIVRIHASSGTTGKQTVVGYTRNDLSNWAELIARALFAAGANRNDVVQVSYGYGLFTGGLGLHYGAERIGASVIPTSGGNSKRQVMMMKDFGSTVLGCTPSYALFLSELMEEQGISIDEIKLRIGIFGAEPWTNEMRSEIEKRLGIKAYNIYGLSEIMGPGVTIDCEEQNGMHVWEDHFYPEIIDPETGKTLPHGEIGELVITGLTKEGIPMIRYRTRDLTRLIYDPCPCGRTHARIDRIMGRSDDMLIIRGVNVFPSQVESVLLALGETSPHYHIIVDREGTLDTMEVQVEVSEGLFSDQVSSLESLGNRIRHELDQLLGISCKVTLVESKTLSRSEGKAIRVTDLRKEKLQIK